jgi:mono/diheme cytochrome c family protein
MGCCRFYVYLGFLCAIPAASAANSALDQQFAQRVRPFVTKYCVACHSGNAPAAQLDLKSYTTVDAAVKDYPRWTLVMEKLAAQQMPPAAMPQPALEDRQQVIEWVKSMRLTEARKNAGDPGTVLARRLSNAEYNYTIRDLTGADIRPARISGGPGQSGRLR